MEQVLDGFEALRLEHRGAGGTDAFNIVERSIEAEGVHWFAGWFAVWFAVVDEFGQR